MRLRCPQSRGGALTPLHGSKVADHSSIQEANGIKPKHSQPELEESRETKGFLHSKPADGPQISLKSHCQTSKEVKGRRGDTNQCRGVEAHILPDKSSSSPLLRDLLLKDSNPTSSSEKANAFKEHKTSIKLPLKRHCNSQQVKKNPTTQNCTLTKIQDQDHSRGTPSISYLEQLSPPSLPNEPPIDPIYASQKRVPLTDDEIREFIVKRVEDYRSILASENNSKKDVVALDEISGSHSTEYPNIMVQVATSTTDEESTPLIHPTVPEMSLDQWTEKPPSLSVSCSSSQEECNITNILDDMGNDPGVVLVLQHTKENEKGDKGEKPMEGIGLDNVQTDVLDICQSKSRLLASGNGKDEDTNTKKMVMKDQKNLSLRSRDENAWAGLNSSIALIHKDISSASGIVGGDVDSVSSQTDFSIAHLETLKEPAHVSKYSTQEVFCVGVLKDQQYEDISDDEMSQGATRLLNSEHVKLNFLRSFEEQPYEDVSQDEDPKIESFTMEKLFLKQTPEPDKNKSKFEKEVSQDEQSYEDGYEGPKRDSKRHSPSCRPSSVFEDDDMDENWIFGPIIMSDLKFEPEDMKEDGPEKVAPSDSQTGNKDSPWSASKPLPVCQLEIFDTVDTFRQAKVAEFQNRFKVTTERSPTLHESHSILQDSSETEDSDDYSSGSEHNFLTASKQVFKKRSAIHKLKDVNKDQTRNFNKLACMQKLKQLIAKAGPKHGQHETNQQMKSEEEDVVTLDSDTENEIYQSCKKKAKRLPSSSSEDSSDASSVYQSSRAQSPKPVDSPCETIKEKSLEPSAASQCQSKPHDTQFKGVMNTKSSNVSHATQRRGPLIETKAESDKSEPKTNRQKISTKATVIILDSDSADSESSESESGADSNENDPNFKKENIESLISLDSSECDDAQGVQQMRHSLETVESKCGTANGNIQKAKRCSAHKIAGKLIKANSGSAHVDPMTKRKKFSEKRHIVSCDSNKPTNSNRATWLSSGSDDSSDDLLAKRRPSSHVKNHLFSKQRSKNSRLSAGKPSNQQCQNVDEDADSSQSPVIPCYVVECSQSNKCLKIAKFNKKRKCKTSHTPTANGKKTHSLEMDTDHLESNEKERFEHNSKPVNDGENTVQTTVATSKLFSRQFSLPCQKRPSSPIRSLPSTSGHHSEARQSSASSSLPKSKQSKGIARQQSFPPIQQRHSSYGNPSTSGHCYAPTRVPLSSPTMQPSARKRLKQDWKDSHVPTKLDRKRSVGVEEVAATTGCDSSRKPRRRRRRSCDDRPPRGGHKFSEAQTPLMKKTKFEAQQWTRDRIRETQSKQRHSVGEGYKWAVKPTVAKPRKR